MRYITFKLLQVIYTTALIKVSLVLTEREMEDNWLGEALETG